ncbi:cation:proton antiporter [Niallia taxi]|uniref:cation:proton antiporter domain-containing protein n=1 Tax=Niallia taxi TaxID=2499688 RepID=UPI003D2DF83C
MFYSIFHFSSVYLLSYLEIISGNGLDGIRSRTIIISEIQHWWSNSLEIAFSIVMIFGSYFIAEHFYVSGVIAVVVAGLIFGNYGAKVGMSDKIKMNIDSFFDTITFFANSSSFLMIGLEIKNINFSNKWGYII